MMETDFRILLIEDNPGDAFLVKFYLNESTISNYDITHAESLKDGIGLLNGRGYDVILLDLNLPDSNGIATLEDVLKRTADGLVIVLTGLTDEDIGLQAVKMGAQDFLVKGQFDGKVLNSAVRYAFERFKLNRKLKELKLRFKKTQQLAKIGYWELHLKSRTVYLSTESAGLIGIVYNPNGMTLEEFLEKLKGEGQQNVTNKIEELMTNGGELLAKVSFVAAPTVPFLIKAQSLSDDRKQQSEKIVGIIQQVL